jgi:hypothetical protein
MAIWATLHVVGRSPAPRRSLVLLVRRLLQSGLAMTLTLALAATPAGAASASRTPLDDAPPVRDIAGPVAPSERDAGVSVGTTTGSPAAPESGTSPGGAVTPPATPGDGQRQGNVVAVFQDPADPLIVIAVNSGYLTVRLRCGSLCPSIHLGDYVVAEGHRRSESVFDAVDIWVVSP